MIWGIGKLPANNLMKNPAGTWSFVGSVDARLAYVQKDGTEPTPAQLDAAAQVGPSMAGVKCRVWLTRDDAIAAATELGLNITDTEKK